MRIIRNRHIPFRGFQAINLFGVIFVRNECYPLSETSINHEKIHTRQMQELGYVFFYPVYVLEWLIRSIWYRNFLKAYYYLSFEREAYFNQENLQYLNFRKTWSFVKYF